MERICTLRDERFSLAVQSGFDLLDEPSRGEFRLWQKNEFFPGELFGISHLVITRGEWPGNDNRGLVQSSELCQRRCTSTTDHHVGRCQSHAHLVNIGDEYYVLGTRRPSLPGNDQKLDIRARALSGYGSFGQDCGSAAAAEDEDSLDSLTQAETLRMWPSGEDLWADGQPRDYGISSSEPPRCAGMGEKDLIGPRGKKPGHHPREEILLVQIYGNSEDDSPEQGRKRPIASKANDRCGAHFQDDTERVSKREGDLGQCEERPECPPRALARTRDPTNRKLVKFNPGIPRQHVRLKPIAAAYVDKPSIRLSVLQPLQESESGIEMTSRPAPADEKRLHVIPFAKY
jgi:hypothetical protein